jgi:hypothetical protein
VNDSIYTGGLKFDAAKPRFDLIPPVVLLELVRRGNFKPFGSHALREVAGIYSAGALKYEQRNWERGMKWTRLIGAAHRHFNAYLYGEKIDRPTGLNHLANIAFCIIGLIAYGWNDQYRDRDDRTTDLTLSLLDVRVYADLFEMIDLELVEEAYLMFIHYTGRRTAIIVDPVGEVPMLFTILEHVLNKLETDAAAAFIEQGQIDFIEDVQVLSETDLKADLDSRDIPMPIITALPPFSKESVVSGHGDG